MPRRHRCHLRRGPCSPERFVQLTQQVAAGDLARRSSFYELLPMIHQMFSFPNPAPVKTVLAQQGLIANELRSPMQWRRGPAAADRRNAGAAAARRGDHPVKFVS